ncbi:phosphoribosyl pyrophosphate synthase-associated protein 2 isoform X2 [Aplysia californica]|nr:phosphoribosyl pyrophosphate synthase-associated protein 2 isoform X2 [Aplysia californica]XP_005106388.1 phosphoribosyl pyrophosphate synthase-associated protein 2 isoform X2 [Aplysia californica]
MADRGHGNKNQMLFLGGTSHPELAQLVASKLGVRLCEITTFHKLNRETTVEIKESVRGKDVYILQTGTKDVNNDIMELMIIAYACRTSSASNIVGVIPYLPYSKQSKMRKRGCIVGKLLATMLGKAGFTHVITMDLHQKEIQGFFNIPVDNLRASAFLIDYIQTSLPDYRNAVIVARNPNSVKRATSYAERLRLGIAVVHGDERLTESDEDDGRTSPPPLPDLQSRSKANNAFGLELLPRVAAKEKPPFNVVGDVGGRIAIIVDDMIDDVDAFVKVADILKERGAYKVLVVATHGVLSSDAPRLIEDSSIDEVVVTNTVPHEVKKMHCHKIKTVDISVLLCEAIRRIHHRESMSYLFRNVGMDD